MKQHSLKKFIYAILIAITLAACGGGGGGSGTTSTTAVSLNGSFVDAPTKGLLYTASPSGVSGTTDANGTYQYQAGDTITFSIPNGANPIVIGSIKPVAPTGGTAVTFILMLTNGEQAAHVLQALNHSISAAFLDVSGLTLDATNAANLNTYIASNGTQLPGNADPTVTTNITNMLSTAQTAASFTGGATITTPVLASFLTTVTAHLQSTMSGISTGLSTPLSTRLPGKLTFTASINAAGGSTLYLIRYRNPNGTAYVKASTLDVPTSIYSYPVMTYTAPASGNVFTDIYPSYTVGMTTYPSYSNAISVVYDDPNITLVTWSLTGGSTATGSAASINMDTSFSQASIAGKTITFTSLANDGCTSANPYVITVDGSGTSFTAACGGTSPPTPAHTNGYTIATVPNMPGVLAISLNGTLIRYWGLVSGTSISNGTLVSLIPGTSSVIGAGHLRAFTSM